MKKRIVTTAILATFALSVPFASAIAAEANFKAGYFISSQKSLTR